MKIFVTGGAGYIGSNCVEQLVLRGDKVAVFDNFSEGHRRAVHPKAKLYEGDLGNPAAIGAALSAEKPDAIMHFAANALVGESMQNPTKYFRNNVTGGINLLEAAVAAGVKRFVFSSTCATFGLPDKVPIDETAAQRPISPYGESKLIFEQILKWYDRLHGLKFVSLRYFNAAGASEKYGEDHRIETHLVPCVLQVALGKRERAEIFGGDYDTPDGTCIRDYIHILDLAQAHLLALSKDESAFYNLGTGGGNSVAEVIECCRRVTGRKIPAVVKDRRPGDPPRLVASSKRIEKELGWKPKYQSLDAIVESAWAWHQKFPDGYGD